MEDFMFSKMGGQSLVEIWLRTRTCPSHSHDFSFPIIACTYIKIYLVSTLIMCQGMHRKCAAAPNSRELINSGARSVLHSRLPTSTSQLCTFCISLRIKSIDTVCCSFLQIASPDSLDANGPSLWMLGTPGRIYP
jgi:hypothetical protein